MPPSLAMFTAADAGGGLEPTEGLGYAAQYPEERTLRRAPDRSHGGCQRLWRLGLHDTHADADVRDHAADDQRCVLRRLGDYRREAAEPRTRPAGRRQRGDGVVGAEPRAVRESR